MLPYIYIWQSVVIDKIKAKMNYKTIGKKLYHVVAPMPKDSQERMKTMEVMLAPYLRDPRGIGHTFNDKMQRKLRVGGG